MDRMKMFYQENWPKDLEQYLLWKEHCTKYPSARSEQRLKNRRDSMVRLYGENAMNGI